MAADLHIHILEGVTEEDVNKFKDGTSRRRWEKLYDLISATPDFWIGEVSWLKAALLEDPESYIPDPVAKVSEIVGSDFPIIDGPLIEALVGALQPSGGSNGYSTCENSSKLREFLETHKGKKVFQVSW